MVHQSSLVVNEGEPNDEEINEKQRLVPKEEENQGKVWNTT